MFASAASAIIYLAATANIYKYASTALRPDDIEYRRVGMWAPSDLPSRRRGVAVEDAFVSLDLVFNRQDMRRPGLVQVAFFHADQLPRIGATLPASGSHAAAGQQRGYCCTAALAAKKGTPGCELPGRLIVAPTSGASPDAHKRHHHEVIVHDISFAANASEARLSQRILVRQSGVHYLLLSSCELRTGVAYFSGRTEWRNPHGHLPAELFPLLPFFGLLTLAYLFLAVAWAAICLRSYSQLLPLQGAVAAVLFLCCAEAATWWRCYHAFNSVGTRELLPTVLGVLVSTIRKTVSRGLVLCVCLGYGVVRPMIGSAWLRILLLGAIYFVAAAALDIASNVSRLEELPLPTRLCFVLPPSVLDAVFFWWCCSAVSATLTQLAARHQSAKLLLYKRFSHVLLALLVLSGMCIGVQMWFVVSDRLDAHWSQLWAFDAFWHMLYLGVLIAICVLWSPSNNSSLQYMEARSEHGDEPGLDGVDDADGGSCGGSSTEGAAEPYYKVERGA